VFRHLGYIISNDTIQHYVLQVDANQSHTLDFKEFLHLMQLNRGKEIEGMREAWEEAVEDELEMDAKAFGKDKEKDGDRQGSKEKDWLQLQGRRIPKARAFLALKELGYKKIPPPILEEMPAVLDFAVFIIIADKCRAHSVDAGRRMAGFTQEQIDKLKASFDKYDSDHGGTIDVIELMPLLEEFGWKPKTHQDQSDVMMRLEKAREAAKQAGVEECTEAGVVQVNFWEFVQLARMIQRHDETVYEEQMSKMAQSLKFTHHELAEFQEIFHTWASKSHQDDSDAESGDDNDPHSHKKESITKEYARRLVRTLGLKFNPETRKQFDDELNMLNPLSELLDFHQFLKLMRWLLDTGFVDEQTKGYTSKGAPGHRNAATDHTAAIRTAVTFSEQGQDSKK